MTRQEWPEVERLLHGALGLPPHERARFLDEACAGRLDLRREVESLLERADSAEGFIDAPALAFAAALWNGNEPGASVGTSVVQYQLQPGARLGAYEIVSPLGAGGMGEVYRARDSQLGRDVAIKVLPPHFTECTDRAARFDREARILAAINHPHIAAIYGVERSGGRQALVLELVPGDTLAERIAHGRLPAREALVVACQVAEALEAAHEKGIVHRDLKPANVKVTPEGIVKVLDFGLAASAGNSDGGSSQSPTVTVGATGQGVVLGTAAYMSPEQARGQRVDRRADIWAFGCLLYELLTGARAFAGTTTTDTLAAVLTKEPDWAGLPPETPTTVRTLLQRCLRKDLRQRLHDAGDARIELESVLSGSSSDAAATPVIRTNRRHGIAVTLAALAVTFALVFVWWRIPPAAPQPVVPTTRATLLLGTDQSLDSQGGIAISPDGLTVAFVAGSSEASRLYIRRLDDWEPRVVPATEGAKRPFFSPDSQWIAFARGNHLERVLAAGGPIQRICEESASPSETFLGGTWQRDGTIVFAMWPHVGLWRVAADGGTPASLTKDVEGGATWFENPEAVPISEAILFTVLRSGQKSIAAYIPGTHEVRPLVQSGHTPRYLPTGHLVYVSDGHLLAVALDPSRVRTEGASSVVIDDVADNWAGGAAYDVSASGAIVFLSNEASLDRLVWRDRRGGATPLALNPRRYQAPVLSPDGQRLAVTVYGGARRNVWVGSVEREPLTRLSFGNDDWSSVWAPDGRRLIVNSGQGGRYNLFWMPADGTGQAERITDSPDPQKATSFSPKGDVVLLEDAEPSGLHLWQLVVGQKQAHPLMETSTHEQDPVFSPDGRWVAYSSDESGRDEVYVRSYPGLGFKTQISVEGGEVPIWNRNGRELFYRTTAAMIAVPVSTIGGFRAGRPMTLFEDEGGRSDRADLYYDVSHDGQRFLMVEKAGPNGRSRLNLMLNWFDELKKRAPLK